MLYLKKILQLMRITRFTERFNFELAYNLPLIGNPLRDKRCNAIFNHLNVAIFRKLRVELDV